MSDGTRLLEDAFSDAVCDVVPRYLSDLGFVVRKVDDWRFNADSTSCRVGILNDWPSIWITLCPLSDGKAGSEIGLGWVVPCLHGRELATKYLTHAHEIRSELERQMEILIRECRSLLCGDFSKWKRVEKCVEKGKAGRAGLWTGWHEN